MIYVGCNVPKEDFIEKDILEEEFTAVQMLIASPQQFVPHITRFEELKSRIEEFKSHDKKVFVHSPYVLVIYHDDALPQTIEYLKLCQQLNVDGYVLHTPSYEQWDEYKTALMKIPEDLRKLVLIENRAFANSVSMEDLDDLAELAGCGVCLDTSHLYASGNNYCNMRNLKFIHLNPALREFGDHIDRHSSFHLNEGNLEYIRELLCFYKEDINNGKISLVSEITMSKSVQSIEIKAMKSLLESAINESTAV